MNQCMDPEIGNLIGRYEFNKLSIEERENFEDHLLKCNYCFQELYEMSHAVETINNNMNTFRKVVMSKKSIFLPLKENIFSIVPELLRPVIPVFAIVTALILAFIITWPCMRSTSNINFTELKFEKKILNKPEKMEHKATAEEYVAIVSTSKVEKNANLVNKLKNSMQIKISDDKQNIIFIWAAIKEADCIHIELIENNDRRQITPKQGILDTSYIFPLKNFNVNSSYFWLLTIMMHDDDTLTVQKKLILNNN